MFVIEQDYGLRLCFGVGLGWVGLGFRLFLVRLGDAPSTAIPSVLIGDSSSINGSSKRVCTCIDSNACDAPVNRGHARVKGLPEG